MHSKVILGAAVFSAAALADISIDVKEAKAVATDVEAYVSSVTANPAFVSDIDAIASAVPSSVIAAAEKNPEAFAEALITATALPAWVSAIPTPAIDSLETLAAKPIKAVEDLESYVESVIKEPGFSSVASVLATAVPSSVEAEIEKNPASWFQAQITATAQPAYIKALPSDVQSDIGSFINEGLSIVASDFEASSVSFKEPKMTKKPSGVAGAAGATGTGAYFTGSASSSPIAFTGAASNVAVGTIGAGMIAAGIVLALL